MNTDPHSNSKGESTASRFDDLDRTLDLAGDLLTEAEFNEPLNANVTLVSFVIPVKDEQATIAKLVEGIRANIPNRLQFEIIFVDDGSTDASWEAIQKLSEQVPDRVRGIRFRHNAGKATSLTAGFQAARGQVVFTMDGDLQDDPQEIPRFLAKLDDGFDLVSGWKKVRHDPWHKVLPSRVFNVFASVLGGVWLHDHNCGFKCYRREVVETITLHGELHRVTPSLANMHGFRCTEIVVKHHPRRTGRSKYGLERILRGLCDVTTTGFLRRFRERPAHFFNGVAAIQCALGGCSLAASLYRWAGQQPAHMFALAGAALLTLATTSFFIGLLAELIIRGPLRDELPICSDTGIQSMDRPHLSATAPPQESSSPSQPLVVPPLAAPITSSLPIQL